MTVQTGVIKDLPYTHPSRFGDDTSKTNPEEMIGASLSGCYSMFLSALLSKKGLSPDSITTVADVTRDEGPMITSIRLRCEVKVDGIDDAGLAELAEEAKANCPISKALASVPEISLDAKLL